MKIPLCYRLSLGLFFTAAIASAASTPREWEGAWRSRGGDQATMERVLLIVDGYFTHTTFERAEPEFHRTFGGPLEIQAGGVSGLIHFDSAESARVGRKVAMQLEVRGSELHLRSEGGAVEVWQRVPETAGPLTGVWRISGRKRGDEIQPMALGPRRTLKVLSGSRFQWIAMNIETGEFSGTGGGRYTFENGVYTEIIEFFSRDATRVGAQLQFQGSVENGQWRHHGLSSRGDPIDEIWSRIGN